MKGDIQNGFRLGAWQVYPLRNLLVGPAGEVHIEPKVMQVLACLADNSGEVVERDTLLDDLWGGRAFSDEPLTRCIAALRRALQDSPKDPEFIQTIPKSGYRLVCPVEALDQTADETDVDGHSGELEGILSKLSLRVALASFVGLILIASIYVVYRSPATSPTEPQLSVEGATVSQPSAFSIAVLPFHNRSPMAEDAFFVDGMHADVLTQLAKLSSLDKVISRTSMEQYRQTSKPMPQIARELGVATVLEGSVQRAGNRVRINVELIDALTDNHLWAETYDRELTVENLFDIQSEISRDVAAALHLALSDEENERLKASQTDSLEAYGEFVLGHERMAMRTVGDLQRAGEHFRKAIELDADYALAYVGLADVLGLLPYYTNLELEDLIVERQASVDKALSLDPASGEAYASLGFLQLHQRDFEKAEQNLLKAIELSPNYATAHHWYAALLGYTDRPEEALVHTRKSIELDPVSPVHTSDLANRLWWLGRVEEAQVTLIEGVKRNPQFPDFYGHMTRQLYMLGRLGEALQWANAGLRLAPSDNGLRFMQCALYTDLGDLTSAERCIGQLEEDFSKPANYLRIALHAYRAERQEIERLVEQIARRDDLAPGQKRFLGYYFVLIGRYGEARSIWQQMDPELYSDEEIDVGKYGLGHVIKVADTLRVDGELERANYLYDKALESMQPMHRIRGWSYQIWDLYIYAARGDKEQAVSTLREALGTGYRREWWSVRDPFFAPMREEPEWNALVAELEADIDRQREWYEAHRDDPLF